ncbi:MAG TPA: PilZ domain-containing protein [Sphingomicrobium sp.]|nr:PilZ domain-containing protein [Sphingomicrobium sp.]
MGVNRKIEAAGYARREPRITVRCEAVLVEEDGCALDVVITDVSREGFKLESRSELEVGSEVWLQVAKLAPVRAIIRWTCGNEAGGVFLEPAAL